MQRAWSWLTGVLGSRAPTTLTPETSEVEAAGLPATTPEPSINEIRELNEMHERARYHMENVARMERHAPRPAR